MKVAVLCVARNSVYRSLEVPGIDLDLYDERRDAWNFQGDCPVVAHPPCRGWSAFCKHQANAPEREIALAPFCVNMLISNGGVLEHLAHSRLWDHLNLPRPGYSEGPVRCIAVDQSWWGSKTRKTTWLLIAHGPEVLTIPFQLRDPRGDRRRWQVLSKNQRAATPPAFAKWLVELAATIGRERQNVIDRIQAGLPGSLNSPERW